MLLSKDLSNKITKCVISTKVVSINVPMGFRNFSGQCFIKKKRGKRFYQHLALMAGLSRKNYTVLKCHTVVYKIRVDGRWSQNDKDTRRGSFCPAFWSSCDVRHRRMTACVGHRKWPLCVHETAAAPPPRLPITLALRLIGSFDRNEI